MKRRACPWAAGLLSLCLALLVALAPAQAEDDKAAPEHPALVRNYAQSSAQGLFHSSLWSTMDKHFHELSPGWQRRYQELCSLAQDTDTASSQLPALLAELKRKFLQAQKSVVFLLLDLAPTTMEAMDNYYLMCRLEEWQWYLADPVRHVTMMEQALATYAAVLREVGDALARPRTADTPANAALLEALPELRSVHALLETKVANLEASITPWLRPVRVMNEQIQAALASTRLVQPQLWINYYTHPLRITQLGWARKWVDLREMGQTLLRGEIFPRPSILGAAVAVFILGGFSLLYRTLDRQAWEAQTTGQASGAVRIPAGRPVSGALSETAVGAVAANHAEPPLWRVLGTALHAQSRARKWALAVSVVCVANLTLDALPSVHVHMPFLCVQVCALLFCVALWARDDKADPPLAVLLVPVITGFLLLEGDASPLWTVGGMIVTQLGSALALLVCRQRSPFARLWLCFLVVGLLFSLIGFARLVALALNSLLFFRVAFVVLRTLYFTKDLHEHPLRVCLVMPLMVAWLYSLGLVVGMSYSGVDVIWDYTQADMLQAVGVHLQLRELFFLLVVGLALLAFGGLSRQVLHRVSRRRSVLDTSAVPVIHAVVNSLLWVLFLLSALGLLGVDMRSLAFIGGALTVGIGLGLQNIISNFFSGLVLIFARVVRGGDLIEVGAVRGRVLSINMRATVVETLQGAILLIPNVEMLNSRLTNWTRNNRHVREDVQVRLAHNNEVDAAMRLMEEVAAKHTGILPDPAPLALLLKSDEGAVDIALQVWVADVDSKRVILSSLQTELLHALTRAGVSLARPELDVVMVRHEN